ncbi:hypothetical protein ACFQBQ_07740 [Granulicella cerasi]|uniref:Uncharacterized protein n=1 Tax=Granulicella cerasi TaxID=741063 RepID=A0ABW1Z7Q8_9BACT|nr:hypothetical protein [Granulicella cerasi]
MIELTPFEQIVKAGGCVYGNSPGQGKTYCRAAVVPGEIWCTRHKLIVASETKASQQTINQQAERNAAAFKRRYREWLDNNVQRRTA